MQSYLQYRRLGNIVRKQLADSGIHHNAPSPVNQAEVQPPTSESQSVNSANPHELEPNYVPAQKIQTRASEKTSLAYALAGINVQKQTESPNQSSDLFIVGWDGENDPQNPRNYKYSSRLIATLLVTALAWIVGAASSINSAVLPQNTAAFHVSDVVGSLVTGISIRTPPFMPPA